MRRFLAFAMCLSGFTLAVSWTRADEPAVAATADEALPPAESAPARPTETPHPPSRPVVIRTEPGSHPEHQDTADRSGDVRERLMRRIDELQAEYATPEFVEQQQRRLADLRTQKLHQLEQLRTQLEDVAKGYGGSALEQVQQSIKDQLARIEDWLEKADEQRSPAAAGRTQDAAAADSVTDQDRDSGRSPRAPDVYREIRRRRIEAADNDGGRASRFPDRSALLEARLQQLQERAAELAESGAAEAEPLRWATEAEIENLKKFIANRREVLDSTKRDRRPDRERQNAHADDPHAGDQELHQRLRHIHAAIEHLEAAEMPDLVENLRKHAEQLQRETESRRVILEKERARLQQQREQARHQAERQRRQAEEATARAREVQQAAAAARDDADEPAAVRELAEQLGELRRELRKLRQEVQELREAAAPTKDE